MTWSPLVKYSAAISTSLRESGGLSDGGAGDLGLWYEAEQCINGKSLKSSSCGISCVTVTQLSDLIPRSSSLKLF